MKNDNLEDIEYVKRNYKFSNDENFKTKVFPKFQMDVFEDEEDIECVLSTMFDDELYYHIYNLDKRLRKIITTEQTDEIICKMKSDINISIGHVIVNKLKNNGI